MTNQDDYEPQAIAQNGNIIITGWDAEYTIEAASAFIGDIAIAIKEARRQLAAIVEACADGHDWGNARNRSWGEQVTAYDCLWPGCTWSKTEPGWLPFEPKQHVVPFASKLLDCTGPGCEWCDNEAFADTVNRTLSDAFTSIGHALQPQVPAPDQSAPIVAKKLGHAWRIDATPEQVQAALNARTNAEPPRTAFEQAIHDALGPGAGARAIDEWWASRPNYDRPHGVIAAVEATTEGGYLAPEKLKAARERLLDGEGRPRPQFAPGGPTLRSQPNRIEDDELLIIGSCGCGHSAGNHDAHGCNVVAQGVCHEGPPRDRTCGCKVPIGKLTTKITGVGTEDTTP